VTDSQQFNNINKTIRSYQAITLKKHHEIHDICHWKSRSWLVRGTTM